MSEYWIKRDDKEYGPYDSEYLREMAKAGQVIESDYIRKDWGQWVPAKSVKGLFGENTRTYLTPPASQLSRKPGNRAEVKKNQIESPQLGKKKTIAVIVACFVILSTLIAFGTGIYIVLPAKQKDQINQKGLEVKAKAGSVFGKASVVFQDKKGRKVLPELKESEKLDEEFRERVEKCNELLRDGQGIVVSMDSKVKSDLEITQIESPEFGIGEKVNVAELTEKTGLTREQMIEKVIPAVAIVATRGGTGSGFLISNNIIATNRHVAGDIGDVVKVRFPSAKEGSRANYQGVVIATHNDRDVALVRLAVSPRITPLILGTEKDCKPGQDIIAIGSPGLVFDVAENAVRVGNFSSMKLIPGYKGGPQRSMLEMGLAVNPGNSGGPVLDSTGKVIGVVTSKILFLEAVSFAEPISELVQLASNVVPGKIMVRKGQTKQIVPNNETAPKNNKSFGVTLHFTIKAKGPLEKNFLDYSFLAINEKNATVAKGWIHSPNDIKIGQNVRLKGWMPVSNLSILESINSFVVEKKPDENESDFMKKFADMVKAGKIQEATNLMGEFDLAWKDSLISACQSYTDHSAPSSRAALANAVSFVVNRMPELRDLYASKFQDQDPAVLKAAIDSVVNLDEIDKDVMKKVFGYAVNRNDQVAAASLNAISKTAPITNELLQLFAEQFDVGNVELKKSILVSLARVKGEHAICVPLIKKALGNDDMALNIEAMELLPKYIASSREELLDSLLVRLKGKNAALSKKGIAVLNQFYPFVAKDAACIAKHVLDLPPELQEQACKSLFSLGPDNAAAEEAIEKLASSIFPEVAAMALRSLSVNPNIKKVNIDLVKTNVRNSNKIIRHGAADSLGYINRAGDSVSLLFDLLGDPDREVANAARISLGKMSPHVGVDDIEILKEKITHKNDKVRVMAYHVLSELGKDASSAKDLVSQGLADTDSMIIFDAIRILDNIGANEIELAKKISRLLDKASVGVSKQKSSSEMKADVQPFDVVYEKSVESVGIVRVGKGSGSCFLVAPRLVVTNKHVTDFVGEQTIVQFPSAKQIANQQIPSVNVWIHPYRDLAVLRLAIDPALPVLPIRPESELKAGQEIISIGSPSIPGGRLVQNSIRKGSFSSMQSVPGEGKVLELDLSANFGNSGGPVIDQTGHVVGVIAFGFRDKERMTFAEPASELLPVLQKEGVAPKMFLMQNQNGDKKNPVLMQRPPVNSVDTSIVALNYLSKFGPEVKFAIPVLRKVLHLANSLEMQKAAMHVISNMKESAVPLIPDLIKKFDYPGRIAFQATNLAEYRKIFLDNKNNQMIREAIASIGAPAASELAKVLYSNEPSERFGALITLQSMNENAKDAMGAIYRITVPINEKSPLVLQQARETYGRLDPLVKKK